MRLGRLTRVSQQPFEPYRNSLRERALMFTSMAISAILVTTSIFFHYEALRLMSVHVPSLPIAVRLKVLTVALGCFAAHTIEVWLYAGAFSLIYETGLGSLKGGGRRAFCRFSLLLCDIVLHNGDRGCLSVRRTPPNFRYRGNQRSVPDRVVYLVHLLRDESALAFAPGSAKGEMKGAGLAERCQPYRPSLYWLKITIRQPTANCRTISRR